MKNQIHFNAMCLHQILFLFFPLAFTALTGFVSPIFFCSIRKHSFFFQIFIFLYGLCVIFSTLFLCCLFSIQRLVGVQIIQTHVHTHASVCD